MIKYWLYNKLTFKKLIKLLLQKFCEFQNWTWNFFLTFIFNISGEREKIRDSRHDFSDATVNPQHHEPDVTLGQHVLLSNTVTCCDVIEHRRRVWRWYDPLTSHDGQRQRWHELSFSSWWRYWRRSQQRPASKRPLRPRQKCVERWRRNVTESAHHQHQYLQRFVNKGSFVFVE